MKEHFSEAGLSRVWMGALPVPEFEFDTDSAIGFRMSADVQCVLGTILIAVERFCSAGPKVVYGFLGCTYEIINQAELDVVVGFNGADVPCLNHDLANFAGVGFLGLDERSAHAVCLTVKNRVMGLIDGLPAGNFTVNYAISSEVGSSPNLFRDLAVRLIDEIVLEVKNLQLQRLSN